MNIICSEEVKVKGFNVVVTIQKVLVRNGHTTIKAYAKLLK